MTFTNIQVVKETTSKKLQGYLPPLSCLHIYFHQKDTENVKVQSKLGKNLQAINQSAISLLAALREVDNCHLDSRL